ncbi:MAG: hypothetical protein JNJ83_20760 [Verrucomicrobiaceae bacterium]|nr:hypothetical protein [Verrucomicrobiaceae bacterium]
MLIATLAVCVVVDPGSYCQSADKGGPQEPGKLQKETRLAFPDPFFRLMALDMGLKLINQSVKWSDYYSKLALTDKSVTKAGKDEASIGFLIGIRLADGVIALMGKDVSKMQDCANDVRELAAKLGISKKELTGADAIVRAVQKDDWLGVHFELGILREEIIEKLKDSSEKRKGVFVAAGAWLQGCRYGSGLVLDHMKVIDLSNNLRASAVVDFLVSEIKTADPKILAQPAIKSAVEVLAQIKPLIDVDRDANIPKERLQQIFDLASLGVKSALPVQAN